ncbi:MAG: TonB-dependent receptor [Deltaproteobacteria bacterium]|jgi:vitamin B12 transporter|nr:TonB-dependent receptor [Deltaproteobacteria bacterium]
MGKKLLAFLVMAISVAASSSLNAQDNSTIETVVITAGRVEESLKDVTTNITVISGETIEKSTANSLTDVMIQQGLTVYNTPGTGIGNVYIRGLSNGSNRLEYESKVVVLINGHRTGNSNLDLISLGNIERIEIIRGPAAVQYGSSALGGIINIITKKGQEGITTTMEAGIGSFDYSTEKLSLLAGHSGMDLALEMNHRTREDYSVGDSGNAYVHNNYKHNYSGDFDLGHTFMENHRLSFHSNFNIRRGIESTSDIQVTWLRPGDFTGQNNTVYNSTFGYEGSTENKLFSWMADYTHGLYEYTTNTFKDPRFPTRGLAYPDPADQFTQRTELNQYTLKGNLNHELASVTIGYDYIRYDAENHRYTYSATAATTLASASSYLENHGVYILGKLRLLDGTLVISAGGRYDIFENVAEGRGVERDKSVSKKNFTPSIGVAWSPLEYLKLRANYSEGFLMPSPTQFNGGGIYYLPSPDLKPEESKTFEIGADLNWNYFDASLTYYHADYTNKMGTTMEPSPDPVNWPNRIYKYINYDGAVFNGIELALGIDIGAAFEKSFKLRPYASLNWTRARNEDMVNPPVPHSRRAVSYVPNFTGAFGIDFSHPESHLDANLNVAYVGKSWAQDFRSGTDRPADWTQWVRNGNFCMVDLSVSMRILDFEDNGNLTVKAKINNVLDEYVDYTLNFPQPGRNFYLGLAYTY